MNKLNTGRFGPAGVLRQAALLTCGLAGAVWLTACGGGGGGSGGATPSGASASVSGVASKGLLKQAVVKVYSVDANGQLGALLTQTRTDVTGHYTVSGLTPGALVEIEVSTDAQTLMADEATGKDVAPASGFKLRAASTLSTSGGTDVLQVTPYSEMAVSMAEANGGLKADVLATANQRVKTYVSYDVLTEEPKFDASNKPLNGAALNLAAVSMLASQKTLSACQQTDLGAAVACVVGQMSQKGVQDTTLAAQLGDARGKVAYTGTEVPPTPTPVVTAFVTEAVKAGVAEAKALLGNIRSNGQVATTDVLQQRLNAVGQSFDQVGSLLGGRMVNAISLMAGGAKRLSTPRQPFVSTFSQGDASCGYFSDLAATVVAEQASAVKSVRCVLETDWNYLGYTQGVSNNQTSETISTYNIKALEMVWTPGSSAGQVQVASRTMQTTRTYRSVYTYAVYDPVTGAMTKPWSSSYTSTDSNPQGLSAFFNATVTGQDNASGWLKVAKIQGSLAPLSLSNPDQSETLDLTVNVGAEGDFTRIDLAGTMAAIRSSLTAAAVKFAAPSFVLARSDVPGDISADSPDNQSGSSASLHVTVTGDDGSTAEGVLAMSLDHAVISQELGRGQASFTATLRDAKQALLFDGKLRLLATADVSGAQSGAYKGATLEVDGTLAMPNSRPNLSVHLTLGLDYTVDRVLKGYYVQGTDTVFVTADVAASGALRSVSVSTPSGIAATYTPGVSTFNLLKGTDVLGVVDVKKGRVDYVDNTFEQY